MATDSQTTANQLNAQKCTGPTTAEGKATSSQNAVKTGLYAKSDVIRTENRDEYESLIADYHARFNPTTPDERFLVDELIRAEWLGRRYMAAIAGVWESELSDMKEPDTGLVFIRCSEALVRAQRCVTATQRSYANALKQLRAIQSERAKRTAQPQPAAPKATATELLNPKLVSFRQSTDAPAHPPAEVPVTAPTHPQTEDSPPIAA